jgi:hypothetical protein
MNRAEQLSSQCIIARQVPREQAEELYKRLNTDQPQSNVDTQRYWAMQQLGRQSEQVMTPGAGDNDYARFGGGRGAAAPRGGAGLGGGGGFGGGGARRAARQSTTTESGRAQDNITATTAPAPRLIQSGDTLTITLPPAIGVEASKSAYSFEVSEGTIALPVVGSVSVNGLTQSQLADQITQKYREANLASDGNITVAFATTQPTQEKALEIAGGAIQQQSQQVDDVAAPVQQRADAFGLQPQAATQPAQDLVDVVIVLTTAQPVAEPTSQPNQAAQQPEQQQVEQTPATMPAP